MGIHKLHIKSTARRILAYNPLGKSMVTRHPRKMLEEKRLIEREGFKIPQGAVKTTKSGIAVQRLANGNYKGQPSTSTFHIRFGKKSFFVKYSMDYPKTQIANYKKARKLFEDKKINGYNVRILMPHIIYGEHKPQDPAKHLDHRPTFVVTDYLDARQGTLYKDHFDRNYAAKDPEVVHELGQLRIAKDEIEEVLFHENISTEQRDKNLFVVPGKKTLWLFDLE